MFNFKQFMFDKSLTQNNLSKIIGEQQSVISLLANGHRKPLKKHLDALVAEFGADVIEQYILPDDAYAPRQTTATVIAGDVTGNGNNFVAGNNNTVETHTNKDGNNEIPIEETVVVSADIVRAPGYDIKEKFMDGDLEGRVKPTQYIIPRHDLKAYTYCDDMEPEIRAGEPVLLKFMPTGCPISPGDMYFLDLPQGGKIRYVLEEKEGILHLRAANHKAYGDIWVKREDVLSISQVMLIMRSPRSMNIDAASLMDIIERKDEQTSQLIEQIDKAGERESRLISIIEQKHK